MMDFRLPAIRARDAILGILQAAFADPELTGGSPDYQFQAHDPQGSPVWITTTAGRPAYPRDGRAKLIVVDRGDYIPQELGQLNTQYPGFDGTQTLSDIGHTSIYIRCEATTETGSEVLASICYTVLKVFRREIQREYDLVTIRLGGISAPLLEAEKESQPWVTVVTLNVGVQEYAVLTEITNRLNRLDILQPPVLPSQEAVVVASLDGLAAGS
jgi:hypothetical protein